MRRFIYAAVLRSVVVCSRITGHTLACKISLELALRTGYDLARLPRFSRRALFLKWLLGVRLASEFFIGEPLPDDLPHSEVEPVRVV